MDDGTAIPFEVARRRPFFTLWDQTKAGLDFFGHNLPRTQRLLVKLNPYPAPWRAAEILAQDGTRLSAWYGPGAPDGPALVMAPGTFQSKDDTRRKRRAMDLWRRLGASVLIVDMRGFGGSTGVHSSLGRDEPDDLLEAARWLRDESGASRVTLWGESLGGSAALLAGARPHADETLAKVIAWSPFADLRDALKAGAADHRRGRTLLGRSFRFLLRHLGAGADDFPSYLRLRAEQMGLTPEELVAIGSPLVHAPSLRVPSFIFHAEDDRVVPVGHARELAATGVSHLRVAIQPAGGHLGFDLVAPTWYEATTRSLLR